MKRSYQLPDEKGMFGQYGGRFVPDQLIPVLAEVERAYLKLRNNEKFKGKLLDLYKNYVGRPSMLYYAERLTKNAGGAKIYLKREDLNHTGSHKINNAVGQALVAQHLGKKKLIAETGAGQHGVAVATVAALFGMKCEIFMGARDVVNQRMNVHRMNLLGAKVVTVERGQGTLKDAIDVALEAFATQRDTYYMLGSAVGPHPYPLMVRDFQSVIGREVRGQLQELEGKGVLPDVLIGCVGGGSNALGLMHEFISDESVRLVVAEPAGEGESTQRHGLSLKTGKEGVIHGFRCLVLQNESGEILESYSAASGLDYPGVSPEFSYLKSIGRIECVGISDAEALAGFKILSKTEGIIPALESAHAIQAGVKIARVLPADQIVVINLSGRGDKDVENVCENLLPKLTSRRE